MAEQTISVEVTDQDLLDKRIHFPNGIPGFPDHHSFVMTQTPEEKPFAWLRSLDDVELAFAVVEAYQWLPEFSFEIDDEILEDIGSPEPQNCILFFILKFEKGDRVRIRANVRAPLLVNTQNRKACQVVLPEDPSLEAAEFFVLEL